MKTTKRSFEAIGRRMLHRLANQLIPNAGTLVMMALLLFAYHAWAAPSAAPQVAPASQVNTGMLSYQGYLTDASDEPLTGDVDITFRLYDAPSGGAALWTEAHTNANAVPVDDGLFNVMLGSLTPISSTVWSSGASYLGVQVGNDAEMAPREVVGNVPTAMTVPDGAITPAKAPTLLETLPQNSIVQYGEAYTTVTENDTWTIDIEIVFPQAFADRPRVVVMPHWNHTQHPVLVIRPSECDETHCVIHVSQSPSGTWDAGQVQWIDWIAIGPKNQEQVEVSK